MQIKQLFRYYLEIEDIGDGSMELITLCRDCKQIYRSMGETLMWAETPDEYEDLECEHCDAPDKQAAIRLREWADIY